MRKLSQPEIEAAFHAVYKGKTNFMTPEVIEYGQSGSYLYELSEGSGFMVEERIFGVTVLDAKSFAKCPELSKGGFKPEGAARAYIAGLKRR